VGSITRGRGPHRLLGLALLALTLGAIAGALPVREVTAQTPAVVSVQKALVLADGTPVMSTDLSGFVFFLEPQAGGVRITLPPTNAAGQTAISVATGNYVLREEPRAGTTFVGARMGATPIGSFNVPANGTVQLTGVNQVAGSATIQIVKQILDQNNNVITGATVSGFSFTVTGPNNFSQSVQTGTTGQATLSNLAAGTYTVTEQVLPGFTLISASVDGALSTMMPTFQINAGQTRTVLFNNRQATGTTVQFTKQVVDVNNNPISSASRAGFTFTVTCGTTTLTGTTDATGTATIANVPGGSCQINETVPSGFTFVSAQVGTNTPITTNPFTFTLTAGQPVTFNVINRQGQAGGQTEAIPLIAGCNNVALTWPAGTQVGVVAAAVTPASAVDAIWRQIPVGGTLAFQAWSPVPNAPNDFTATTIRPEAAWICVRTPATLNRPVVQ
jgi:hypothetical protein